MGKALFWFSEILLQWGWAAIVFFTFHESDGSTCTISETGVSCTW